MGNQKEAIIFEENIFAMTSTYSFLSKIEAKSDDKGRLCIPASYRRQIAEEESYWILRKNDADKYLELCPKDIWDEELAAVKGKLNLINDSHKKFLQRYVQDVEVIKIDKIGRLLVPKRFLDMAGIASEVVFAGMGERIALWSKAVYEQEQMSDEEYLAMKNEIFG